MAETKMSYILVEKKTCSNESLEMICIYILNDICVKCEDNALIIIHNDKEIVVNYRIKQKKSSSRCYLELVAVSRVTDNVAVLTKIDEALRKTRKQEFYYLVHTYDGVSDYYCSRLYPKFAQFERLLREFLLVLLLKSYGVQWFEVTATDEVRGNVKKVARKSTNYLEHMDFSTMRKFLFERHMPNIEEIFDVELSPENLEKMEADDIRVKIEELRPKCLWEQEFIKYGSVEQWSKDFGTIHDSRNKIAHHKTINRLEFDETNKVITRLNKNLISIIDEVENCEFNEMTILNTIGNFARLVRKLQSSEDIKRAVLGITQVVSKAVLGMQHSMKSPSVEALASFANTMQPLRELSKYYMISDSLRGAAENMQRLSRINENSFKGMLDSVEKMNTAWKKSCSPLLIKTNSDETKD